VTAGGLVAFLGPSLPWAEARALAPGVELRPPARQGDVFRVLRAHPRAIALIDGVFESQPSVWHHELLAARAAGALVLGASSMGALRAAELPGVVVPVGTVARRYLGGAWNDDAFVALLHADASLSFRPLTLPHVNVWATAEAARREGWLGPRRARQLVAASERLFYQDRTWASLAARLPWPAAARRQLLETVRTRAVDVKAADARACLRRLARAPAARPPRPGRFSSLVRRVRLDGGVDGAATAEAGARGVRRLLLAALAASVGLEPAPASVRAWLARLPREGWADDERAAAAEALALEAMVLQAPAHFVSDGPSLAEGGRLEAMVARAGAPR
jgi:hypothetical protein